MAEMAGSSQAKSGTGAGAGGTNPSISSPGSSPGAGNNGTEHRQQALSAINRELEEKATAEHAKQIGLAYIDVGTFPINPDILKHLHLEEAKVAIAIPFYKTGKNIRLAVADPQNAETISAIKHLEEKDYKVDLYLASKDGISQAMALYASQQYIKKGELKNIVKEEEVKFEKELENMSALKDKISAMPSEEALNMLNVSAIKAGASDVHYQPEETSCTVRFRIDGILRTVFEVNRDVYTNLINQLKYKAKMKLNISSEPQDGRYRFIVNENKIDVRVSSIPTEYGESIVCRILNSSKKYVGFEELGFAGRGLQVLKSANERPQGMILVTGPTGSGKTTTLYVALNNFNTPDVNIITLEDPIEYHLRGITQSQVNEKRGYTFADGLKSILRQDPDIVMIGEIRDLNTAQAAAQAALTGHVVLSTLHTNSAVETIPRLINIGLSPFMVGPALSVVIAQRLVRRLCSCAAAHPLSPDEKAMCEKVLQTVAKIDPSRSIALPEAIKSAKGCEACNNLGFRGQIIVSELFDVDDEIEQAILQNMSSPELLVLVRKKGMITMYEDAILKAISGITTLDEVHRVIAAM